MMGLAVFSLCRPFFGLVSYRRFTFVVASAGAALVCWAASSEFGLGSLASGHSLDWWSLRLLSVLQLPLSGVECSCGLFLISFDESRYSEGAAIGIVACICTQSGWLTAKLNQSGLLSGMSAEWGRNTTWNNKEVECLLVAVAKSFR